VGVWRLVDPCDANSRRVGGSHPVSVAVSGTTPSIGFSSVFTATANLSNSSTQNVSTLAAWQSSNMLVANVSTIGSVTGVGAGEADIRATHSGCRRAPHHHYRPADGAQSKSITRTNRLRRRLNTDARTDSHAHTGAVPAAKIKPGHSGVAYLGILRNGDHTV
jgi:hypothetical protein